MQPEFHQITTRKSANHLLHLLLTLFTCGLWAPVWIIMAIVGKKEVGTMQGFTATPQQPYPPQQYGQPYPPSQYGQVPPSQPYGYPAQPPAALPPTPQQPRTTTWGQKHAEETEGGEK